MAKWVFEAGHTAAEFRARHMMVSWVRGHFKNVHGTLEFNSGDSAHSSTHVTINAAEFMGISDRVGSLEPGKQATLLITTGTPLDMTSDIEQSYIQGREIDMMDIQKFFFEKYMQKVLQSRRIVS